jgi:hypothetical protein
VVYSLIDSTYVPDGAASAVTDGNTANAGDQTANGTVRLLSRFPFLGHPHSGFDIPALHDSSKVSA